MEVVGGVQTSVGSESLRSLHQLLRVRQCPYFYVCGAAFTVLFRAAGVAGCSQAHALITPTTRGLREAMRAEDIEFTMPLHHEEEEEEDQEEEEEEEKEEKEVEREEEEQGEATSWLEDLGVETSLFPNLNPNRAKVERERLRHVDSRPSSMVCVEGMDTQALINFLINSKSCVAVTGGLAGVPPTLLAPVAFQGATLRPLKVKGGVVRLDGATHHSMEVTGPLLPHTVHQLARCSHRRWTPTPSPSAPCPPAPPSPCTATGRPPPRPSESVAVTDLEYDAQSDTERNDAGRIYYEENEPQIVMGSYMFEPEYEVDEQVLAEPEAFAQEGLVDCGLDVTTRQLLCAPPAPHNPLPPTYREVTCQDGKYTWSDQ
ncbi:Protein downstream neighbor of Son [Chionoecetes opilio]|uniref:Protein downstream neighbor of Son n=1 Tax=Chionoecetes opilio TaxID=41210 RepID=A0A8J5CK65_CHIOP|nr:Protein downstream neighbor of Son [Chionoecetes opilio]